MHALNQCDLIYISQTQDDNGNPIINTYEQTIKCSVADVFSVNYYQNQTRDMRKSINLIVGKTYAHDQLIGDAKYQLEFLRFNGLRYKVRNILKMSNSAIMCILDCEEVASE